VPLMGLSAAFVFAAQMLNFPVAGGTSGHLLGGVLASVLLGPSAAVLVLTSVLTVQCFLFSDGGLTALGANIFNMGVISSVGGYYLYQALWRLMPTRRGQITSIAVAAWVTTVLASIVCAGELAASGTIAWSVAFPAMAGVHMLIGIGEAIITCMVVVAISQARPDLLSSDPTAVPAGGRSYREFIIYGLLIAAGLALFISPFADKNPDGLDRVSEKQPLHWSPMPNYLMPSVPSVTIATSLAGIAGTGVAFLLGLGLARVLVRDQAESDDSAQDHPGQGPPESLPSSS